MCFLTLKLPAKLQPYGLYVYYVVHICDFGMLRVKTDHSCKVLWPVNQRDRVKHANMKSTVYSTCSFNVILQNSSLTLVSWPVNQRGREEHANMKNAVYSTCTCSFNVILQNSRHTSVILVCQQK